MVDAIGDIAGQLAQWDMIGATHQNHLILLASTTSHVIKIRIATSVGNVPDFALSDFKSMF